MNLLLVKVRKMTMKVLLIIILSLVFGCNNRLASKVDVSPKHFKVQTPFILDRRGVILNTYWGKSREHHVLCLDNYSPSWIKTSAVQYDQSFTKSKDLRFKTLTADGSPVQGEVAVCDSLFFEHIVFSQVPFYVMPDNGGADKTSDGVLGLDAMAKGIWKIDFKKEELTFVSDLDSLTNLNETEIFPANFTGQSIEVNVDFGERIVKTMAIDLGYNGDLLLPLAEFQRIGKSSKVFNQLSKFSTPASRSLVNQYAILDTVNINHNWFATIISSRETVKERLIGLLFFRRFSYVIFDFVNNRVYIPKKVW
jgi:hypothetical protein